MGYSVEDLEAARVSVEGYRFSDFDKLGFEEGAVAEWVNLPGACVLAIMGERADLDAVAVAHGLMIGVRLAEAAR